MDTINLLPSAQETILIDFGTGSPQLVEFVPGHPHNWALEVTAEIGIPGLLLVLSALFVLLKKFSIFLTGDTRAVASAGIILTGIFWGSALFNFSIWSSWWLATYFTLLGLIMAGLKVTSTAETTVGQMSEKQHETMAT